MSETKIARKGISIFSIDYSDGTPSQTLIDIEEHKRAVERYEEALKECVHALKNLTGVYDEQVRYCDEDENAKKYEMIINKAQKLFQQDDKRI